MTKDSIKSDSSKVQRTRSMGCENNRKNKHGQKLSTGKQQSKRDGYLSHSAPLKRRGIICEEDIFKIDPTSKSIESVEQEANSFDTDKSQDSPVKITTDDYSKLMKDLFGSNVSKYVVHTSLNEEKNIIDVYVDSGKSSEVTAFVSKLPVQHMSFNVMEGASVEWAVLTAVPNTSEVDPTMVQGDSLSYITPGLNIRVQGIGNSTLGAICEDKEKNLFLLTTGHSYRKELAFQEGKADTYCSLLRSGKREEHHISDRFISFIGHDNYGNSIDVAAVPLFPKFCDPQLDLMQPLFGRGMASGENIPDKEDVMLVPFTGPSAFLINRPVQKRGAITGYTRGMIIATEANIHIPLGEGGQRVNFQNCLIIGSDADTPFGKLGDSGSLIIDDQNGDGKEAIGLFFCMLNNTQYISPATKRPYKSVAACVRLDKALKMLQTGTPDLSLSLYMPKNTRCLTDAIMRKGSPERRKAKSDTCLETWSTTGMPKSWKDNWKDKIPNTPRFLKGILKVKQRKSWPVILKPSTFPV